MKNILLMLAEELHNLSCLVREHVGTTLAINNNDRGTRLVKKNNTVYRHSDRREPYEHYNKLF